MGRLRHGNPAGVFAHSAAVRSALLAAVVSLLACSGVEILGDYPPSTCDLAEPPAQLDEVPLAVATFWDDPNERLALDELGSRADALGYRTKPDPIESRVAVQRLINYAFENDVLPDIFQVNGGADVLRWVHRLERESTDVCAIDLLRDEHGWTSSYFKHALSPLSCNGSLYALPVGIHRLNVLFYNAQTFAELAELAEEHALTLVEPSKLSSVDDLLEHLDMIQRLAAMRDDEEPLIPLAVGSVDRWPLTTIAFENVLLSLSHEAYETLFKGGLREASADDRSRLRATLEEMLQKLEDLKRYSGPDLIWQAALAQVGAGTAYMAIAGDWGWAQMDTTNVNLVTFPGTAGTFVYTPDSFAVPRDRKKHRGSPARSFLQDVVPHTETLIAFSNLKYAIPARSDLSPSELARLTGKNVLATYEEFKRCDNGDDGCKLLLAVSGLAPPPGKDDCFDEVDALLTFAVWGDATYKSEEPRLCKRIPPMTAADARSQLIEVLMGVAEEAVAPDCLD